MIPKPKKPGNKKVRPAVLGVDVGATKTAWMVLNDQGVSLGVDRTPTPENPEELVSLLAAVAREYKVKAVGIGIPGTVNTETGTVLVCTNAPQFNDFPLAEKLSRTLDGLPCSVDNDARCALIGEVWLGAAQNVGEAVLLTVGTGIGGAVMHGGIIEPHPTDIIREIGRLVVDANDLFPANAGSGTVEAFLGGDNIEDRFQVNLKQMAQRVREKDPEAIRFWQAISYYFIQSLRFVHDTFHCDLILIGGVGSQDLPYYLQDEPPCPVAATKFGGESGLYGAGRIALDTLETSTNP